MDAQIPQSQAQQPATERAPRSLRIVRTAGESEEEWRRRRNRARQAQYRNRHPDQVRAQYARRRANYARQPGRAPYSPRTFRQPGETEEECKRRMNREKKRRYKQRHPERVRAQKRGQYHRHRDAIREHRRERHYEAGIRRVSLEELDHLRGHIREAIREKEIICLECGGRLRRLANHLKYHLKPERDKTEEYLYRDKWGYNRASALYAKEEAEEVRKEAKRRHWGLRPDMVKQRFPKGRRGVRVSRTLRSEARMNLSDALRGKPRPWMLGRGNPDFMKRKRKSVSNGQVVTDARMAQLRLHGHKVEEIATQLGMSPGSVSMRLRQIGFGGRDIAFDRGAVVTGTSVVNLCQDFNLTRVEVSKSLGKSYDWASGRTGPANLNRPLSAQMAREVLALRSSLREDLRKKAPTKLGGRPSPLTASERFAAPAELKALQHDLNMLKEEAVSQQKMTTLSDAWSWLCHMQRHRKLQTLFFWPQFFRWIEKSHGDWSSFKESLRWLTDIALEFMADEHQVGVYAMDEAARPRRG